MTVVTSSHYQLCAVDIGVDPDGLCAEVLYDDCVNLKAARNLRAWVKDRPRFENSFLFVRKVVTSVSSVRVSEDAR